MPFINEISNYIVATSTRFALGDSSTAVPLYMGKLPAAIADTAVTVIDSGGSGPLYTQNGTFYLERPTIQVITRSSAYSVARDNAETIYNLLANVTNLSISKTTSTGTTTYLTVTPLQSPSDMGQDAEERPLVTCNYLAEKEPS